ncbi:sodium-dependent lysophosphatidylcholine symporter 1-A isoform X2 [Chanos chanos]|uniref:Sodium-dependent lysophosphatidylcholine symporter 1-A isoform X2 n=1 Tax=Chanos chanos TaxID=29144 RepID=A0A6J2V7N9_CHACN|nr:sodium-dependent lysophosphatidylcholine symporter 1-B-like isoform X2 [Chanos chanos]
MARGEGAEQFSATLLPHVKPVSQDGIKIAKHQRSNHLSLCSKLCYAVGGAPYQITGSALGFFLQIYLLDVAQLEPFYASIILFVGRAWDAVTDPTVGFLVSRSRWTRFGRMMPWILISTPLAVLSYILIWVVPSVDQLSKLMWYLIFYCVFQSLQTCFHVPYSALTMFISPEQKERDSATAFRMTIEVLSIVVGTAIQGLIVGNAIPPCVGGNLNLTNGLNATIFNSSQESSLDKTKQAYLIASGVISGVYVLCAIVLFLGVREQEGHEHVKVNRPLSFCEGLHLVLGYKPYVKLVMGFLFTSLAFMLLEGNFNLFCIYVLGFRDHFANILMVIMLSGTLSIPFWHWFLTRFGKKTAVYFGITWAVPFLILIVLITSNLVASYLIAIAAGISVAAAFLLPWSMLPDVVDDFKVQNPDSHGHEAIFYSFYVFFTKFASGVSLGISTLSLEFAGYVSNACVQPDKVHLTLKILVSLAPVVLIGLGLLIFKTYPISEERRQGNRKILQNLRYSEQDSESESTENGSSV